MLGNGTYFRGNKFKEKEKANMIDMEKIEKKINKEIDMGFWGRLFGIISLNHKDGEGVVEVHELHWVEPELDNPDIWDSTTKEVEWKGSD